MVKLGTYAAASAAGAAAVVFHAFNSRGQFYPAMRYLATSKISVVLLSNMALVLMCAAWQIVKLIFLGRLREAEVERLNEQSWRELMEILFAMTIFREEFNVSFVAMVTVLLFIKAFHWLAQKRVEFIETTPATPRLSHIRMVSFLAFLLLLDGVFLYNSAASLIRTKRSSVALLFAFEYMILATSTVAIFLKYAFYVCDMFLEGQWENKAVFTFYLELVRDLLHLSLYLLFFFAIFINYGLPLHLVRELYETFRNFKSRVSDFVRYRKITSNMNDRFPDVTPEELGRGDATCIICREEMAAAKKLTCGHFFHVHCLRSWLERQQTCPTCRSPVLAPETRTPAAAVDGAVPPMQPLQPQQQHSGPPEQGRDAASGTSGSHQNQMHGMVPPAGTLYSSPEAARLQAAAAAASQYSSSFVYPVLSGRELIGYPMYLYYVPQSYLAAWLNQNTRVGTTSAVGSEPGTDSVVGSEPGTSSAVGSEPGTSSVVGSEPGITSMAGSESHAPPPWNTFAGCRMESAGWIIK
ncbi:hypothetical protein KP509_11G081400 [Ceratopteris richardii]|uniref:RING-type E3 ubiquitin transferase n=1 Tax=Ceratopteris richardii TaxID=49495 RepID=A0A8T2TWP6_CERRI|nr:hypothetical protein KP509_11G081400 [Ceratopteris richardii]